MTLKLKQQQKMRKFIQTWLISILEISDTEGHNIGNVIKKSFCLDHRTRDISRRFVSMCISLYMSPFCWINPAPTPTHPWSGQFSRFGVFIGVCNYVTNAIHVILQKGYNKHDMMKNFSDPQNTVNPVTYDTFLLASAQPVSC